MWLETKEYKNKWAIDVNIKNIPDDLNKLKSSISVPDALRVARKKIPDNLHKNKTTVSGEFFWEKKWYAPWEKFWYKAGPELIYLNKCRKLSDEDYTKLFTGFINVRQWYFWDCYLVSTIKSLARTRYFDTLMKTSIEKDGDNSFTLCLPLWNPNWKKIHISKEELNLAQIKWSTWYKILEVWFAKELFLSKNWSLLYPWEMPDITLTKKDMDVVLGKNSFYALSKLLWYSSIKREVIENKRNKQTSIFDKLMEFDPMNLELIIVSSRRRPKEMPYTQKTYEVDNQKMYYHHAYSLYAVEKSGNKIEKVILEDPANAKRKITLSRSGFMSSFYSITTCSPQKWFLQSII